MTFNTFFHKDYKKWMVIKSYFSNNYKCEMIVSFAGLICNSNVQSPITILNKEKLTVNE